MTPPVRGWRRVQVAGLLAGSSAASGALTGFAAGAAWTAAALPAPGVAGLAVVLALCGAGEVAFLALGRPRPPAVRRQVPQAWSRLFDPRTVAVLFGARLGTGPLTILDTWAWWAAFLLSASAGPAAGALAGAVFGGVRVAVMVGVAGWAGSDMPGRMARVRTREPVAAAGTAVVPVMFSVTLIIAAAVGG